MEGPLEGIRILDLSQWQQGPYATTLLSDLGANVIKVEKPEFGDAGRHGLGWPDLQGLAPDFFAHNRGKRGMTIELSTPQGREIVLELASRMDVCVNNFRLGMMERWGLSYEAFRERNPRLIYAQASGSGPKGPDSQRPMFDIVAQGMGGIMSVTGEQGRVPTPVGTFMGDQVGALMLSVAILAALAARERSGRGQRIDVSLLGSLVAAQSFEITHYLFTNDLPKKAGRGHPHGAPLWYTFQAEDGYFTMAGVRRDRWSEFCRAVGDPNLADDPSFSAYEERASNHGALVERLDELFRKHPVLHWVSELSQIGVSCGPVEGYDKVVENPQVLANDYITEMDHPHAGRIRIVNTPIGFSETPAKPRGPAPELGQHTEEVLLELGYDWPRIVELRDAGVI